MQGSWINVAFFLSIAASAWLQQPSTNTQSSPGSDASRSIYYEEDGVKAPALAPTDFSPVVSKNCDYDSAGIVRISLVVNPQGRSEKVAPLYPFNDDIDKIAVTIAEIDRFSPGAKDGTTVPVAQELEIKLTLCTVKTVDKDGATARRFRLKSTPMQRLFPAPKQPLPALPSVAASEPATPELKKRLEKMSSDVSAPVPVLTPEAEWPREQRGVEGRCFVQLVVDANGQPQALRVRRGTNEEFNEKALEAVAKYRFKPAKKGKDPVATKMTIEVNFRSH